MGPIPTVFGWSVSTCADCFPDAEDLQRFVARLYFAHAVDAEVPGIAGRIFFGLLVLSGQGFKPLAKKYRVNVACFFEFDVAHAFSGSFQALFGIFQFFRFKKAQRNVGFGRFEVCKVFGCRKYGAAPFYAFAYLRYALGNECTQFFHNLPLLIGSSLYIIGYLCIYGHAVIKRLVECKIK